MESRWYYHGATVGQIYKRHAHKIKISYSNCKITFTLQLLNFHDSPFNCSQVVYEYSYVTNLKEVYGTDPSAYAITNSDDRPEVNRHKCTGYPNLIYNWYSDLNQFQLATAYLTCFMSGNRPDIKFSILPDIRFKNMVNNNSLICAAI